MRRFLIEAIKRRDTRLEINQCCIKEAGSFSLLPSPKKKLLIAKVNPGKPETTRIVVACLETCARHATQHTTAQPSRAQPSLGSRVSSLPSIQ